MNHLTDKIATILGRLLIQTEALKEENAELRARLAEWEQKEQEEVTSDA